MVGMTDRTSNAARNPSGNLLGHPFPLWLAWVLATGAATASGRVFVTALNSFIPGDTLPIDPLIIGLIVGLSQWLVLRRRLSVSAWWSATTGLWLLAEWSVFAFRAPGGFLGGLIVGCGQWLVLKSKLPAAWVWIAISAFAWGLGVILAPGLNLALGTTYLGQYVIFHTLIAALTGAGLVWLLNKNQVFAQ